MTTSYNSTEATLTYHSPSVQPTALLVERVDVPSMANAEPLVIHIRTEDMNDALKNNLHITIYARCKQVLYALVCECLKSETAGEQVRLTYVVKMLKETTIHTSDMTF